MKNQKMNPLDKALSFAEDFLESLDSAPVGVSQSYDELLSLWDINLPQKGMPAEEVIEEINAAARPGLMHNQSGRFFSWVIGGSHPAALAADWLTSTWDQNAGLFVVAPSASIVEEIAGNWLKQLFRLPDHASFAFVTGCQMAHFTCLNAARNHLYHEMNWDIEAKGFYGAPRIRVICSDEKHITVSRAIRMLGIGTDSIKHVPSDSSGRIKVDDLEKELKRESDIPAIIVLQAGDVNTGAFDDFKKCIPLARQYNSWVHVDGAFGLWACTSPQLSELTEGIDAADSWATDGHKWLNVPYDCGYAFTAHPDSHRRSLALHASYVTSAQQARDQVDWTPEFSRRARGFATYAAIKELGAEGITELINRCCKHALSIVTQAGELKGAETISMPVINQGLIRFKHPTSSTESDHALFTEQVISEINKTGEAFFQPTTFKGIRCMRVSVTGWRTNDEDVHRTINAIKTALENCK